MNPIPGVRSRDPGLCCCTALRCDADGVVAMIFHRHPGHMVVATSKASPAAPRPSRQRRATTKLGVARAHPKNRSPPGAPTPTGLNKTRPPLHRRRLRRPNISRRLLNAAGVPFPDEPDPRGALTRPRAVLLHRSAVRRRRRRRDDLSSSPRPHGRRDVKGITGRTAAVTPAACHNKAWGRASAPQEPVTTRHANPNGVEQDTTAPSPAPFAPPEHFAASVERRWRSIFQMDQHPGCAIATPGCVVAPLCGVTPTASSR